MMTAEELLREYIPPEGLKHQGGPDDLQTILKTILDLKDQKRITTNGNIAKILKLKSHACYARLDQLYRRKLISKEGTLWCGRKLNLYDVTEEGHAYLQTNNW